MKKTAFRLALTFAVLMIALLSTVPLSAHWESGIVDSGGDSLAGFGTSMTLDSQGNPVIAYANEGDGYSHLMVMHCDDPACVDEEPEGVVQKDVVLTSIAIDQNDNPVILSSGGMYPDAFIALTRCVTPDCTQDNGYTLIEAGGAAVSLALDATGNPVFAFSLEGDLAVVHCSNWYCNSWVQKVIPNTFGVTDFVSIQLDSNGNPVVAYYDEDDFSLFLVHCDDPNCAGVETPQFVDGTGRGEGIALTLDSLGNPVMSYFDRDSGDLMLTHCDDPNCAGDEIHTQLDVPSTGVITSIAVDEDDNPVIATPHNSTLIHCDDPHCMGTESIQGLDPSVSGAYIIAVAVGEAGNPFVAYGDIVYSEGGATADLKLVTCDDPNCVGDSPSVIDPGYEFTGYAPDIVIDHAGNPVISYFNITSGKVMLTHCDDPDCLDETPISLPSPSTGSQDVQLLIRVDANNHPLIAYRWMPNSPYESQKLYYVRCGNPACTTIASYQEITQHDRFFLSDFELDGNGNPVFATDAIPPYAPSLLYCSNVNCTGTIEIIEMGLDTDIPTSLALEFDANGNPVVIYNVFSGIRFIRCSDPQCTDGTMSILPVDIESSDSYFSMKLDSVGNPVFVWNYNIWDFPYERGINMLTCHNPACTSYLESEVIVADLTDVSRVLTPELILSANDNPIIAYHKLIPSESEIHVVDTMLVRCDDPYCYDEEPITLAAGNRFVSSYLGLAGADGEVFVTYYNANHGDLMLSRWEADTPVDFNADDVSEVVIFRGGAWHLYNYADGSLLTSIWTGFGSAAAYPLMMDYDGDGDDNLTVYDSGAWHFFNDDGSYLKGLWVAFDAIPVPADYDGDGADDVALFDNGAWHQFDFATGAYLGGVWTGTGTGSPAYPAPMDIDGDGADEFTVYNSGAWHFFNDDGSYRKGIWVAFMDGIPVPGDYDGDGTDDVVLYQNGAWHWFDFTTGAYSPAKSVYTGIPPHKYGGTSLPAPLDYDGDGSMDHTMYAGGPWHFYAYDGSLIKTIPTGGVLGDIDVSARPALP